MKLFYVKLAVLDFQSVLLISICRLQLFHTILKLLLFIFFLNFEFLNELFFMSFICRAGFSFLHLDHHLNGVNPEARYFNS